MANNILTPYGSKTSLTITLASLANSTAGVGRQSTMVDNTTTKYGAALIDVKIQSGGSTPTAGNLYLVYLLRGDDPSSSTYRTDGAGASDAGITINNANLIGSIRATANANTLFYGDFDTAALGPLGPEWGIAVVNSSGQALNASGHLVEYIPYFPQIQ